MYIYSFIKGFYSLMQFVQMLPLWLIFEKFDFNLNVVPTLSFNVSLKPAVALKTSVCRYISHGCKIIIVP